LINIRGKKINLGESCKIHLLIDVMLISHHKISIVLYILTTDGMIYLPFGFQFNVLNSSECFLKSTTANHQDKWMKQEITGELGEEFIVVLQFDNYAAKIFFML
jgi:hypothetical protein